MNWKSTLFIALLALASAKTSAQAYKLQVTNKHFPSDTIYLINYFGKKLYYADTTTTDKNGKGIFTGSDPLKPGKYSIMARNKADKMFMYEILIDEQKFNMVCDTNDRILNTSFKNSETNELFYEYVRFISEKKSEVQALNAEMDGQEDADIIKNNTAKIRGVNDEVQAYQRKMIEENKDNWAAQLVGMSLPIDIPETPKDENGAPLDSSFQYNYYIAHYWDNVPLKNPAIVRTPEYDQKLNDYMNKALIQLPDTMTKYADQLLDEVSYDDELFKFTLHFITYNFEKSKIMGHDAGFVHMVDKYYATGQATWLDSAQLASVVEKANGLRNILIGKPAPRVWALKDKGGTKEIRIRDVEADYTVLYIWSPDCGHCKKENPRVVEFQKKYAEHGVKVYAIGNPYETKEWLEYLNENPEFDQHLINVSDFPPQGSRFRTDYDVHSTPVVMLLDKDKNIKAKQVSIEQLGQMMDRELGLNLSGKEVEQEPKKKG